MKIVAIIQARMGSTRLPGKVLAIIGGRSMLAHICRRVSRVASVDQIVVATTLRPEDGAVVEECDRLAVACFRGSEQDVLDRYHQAATRYEADVVVRITADCPLIDPQVTDEVIGSFLQQRPDYASNTLRRTWPRGLDAEVMTVAALARARDEATEPHQRVHVTPYLYEHPEAFQLLAVTRPEEGSRISDGRWTVDLPADLEFVRAVYERLGPEGSFSWQDVRRLLAREPTLAELNRHVRHKELVEG